MGFRMSSELVLPIIPELLSTVNLDFSTKQSFLFQMTFVYQLKRNEQFKQ